MGDTIKNSRRAYVFISALVSVLLFLLGLVYNVVRKMAQDPSPEPTPDPGGESSPEPGADPTPEPSPGPVTDPVADPEPGADPVPEPSPGPVGDPEPSPEPDPAPEPGPHTPRPEPGHEGPRVVVTRPEPDPGGTPATGPVPEQEPSDIEVPGWVTEYLNVENVARGTAAAAVLTAFKQAGPLGVGRAAAGGAVITRDGPIGRHLPRYGEGEDVAEPQPGSVVYWINQNTPFNVRLDNPDDDSGGATGGDTGVADPSTPTTPDDPHRTSGGGGWDPNPDPDPPDDDEPDEPGDTVSGRDGPYLRM